MNQEVLKAIAERRSIRSYKADPVSREQLDQLLAAAVQAPSARNSQPWHFSVVRDEKLLTIINQEVAAELGRSDDIFYQAPLVIFLSADPQGGYSRMDCGIAVENIALAAHGLGLGSVILGMPSHAFKGEKADWLRQRLCFPAGYDFMIAIAVGWPAAGKDPHPVDPGKISLIEPLGADD